MSHCYVTLSRVVTLSCIRFYSLGGACGRNSVPGVTHWSWKVPEFSPHARTPTHAVWKVLQKWTEL